MWGQFICGSHIFAKCPELAILCTNWNESLIPLLTKKPMFYQTYLYIWMCGAIWNYILDSPRILHALQVPNVGDAVHSPQLSGDRRHVCLLLHRQCGVQRTVWLPYPGQALPVLLKVSWSTHRHLTIYIHVYFSYYKKIYPYLKKKPTFLHVGRVHNALLFRNIGTCNVKCRWFNNEFYTCKYFWAEGYILNNYYLIKICIRIIFIA